MRKSEVYSLAGFFFVMLTGTVLHFVYEWSGESPVAAVFAPVNESVWEHLKMLFWPFLAWGIVEFIAFGSRYRNFIPVKVMSLLLGMFAIMAIFYTYSGIIGKNLPPLDILTFAAGVAAAFLYSSRKLWTSCFSSPQTRILAIGILVVLIAATAVFTFYPPGIGLFTDYSGV